MPQELIARSLVDDNVNELLDGGSKFANLLEWSHQ